MSQASPPPPSGKTGKGEISRVWSFRRQLMGNLWPILVSLPFSVGGLLWIIHDSNLLSPGFLLLIFSGIVAAVSLNWLGSPDNAAMRSEFVALYSHKLAKKPSDRTFVGFAQPAYSSLFDPHQDVGFLCIGEDSLEFVGERFQIRLEKSDCKTVRFRPNPHALLGLGRWVSLEGDVKGKPFRLLIEPREARTLRQNRHLGTQLRDRLATWMGGSGVPGGTLAKSP